jgi:hypothetical protein
MAAVKEAKARRDWHWVTRNPGSGRICIWPGQGRPVLCHGAWDSTTRSGRAALVCARQFKALFGFLPEAGQCLKVRFRAEVMGWVRRRR